MKWKRPGYRRLASLRVSLSSPFQTAFRLLLWLHRLRDCVLPSRLAFVRVSLKLCKERTAEYTRRSNSRQFFASNESFASNEFLLCDLLSPDLTNVICLRGVTHV